jgi:membrane protease YdiL (CAAX protease family)
MSRGRAIAEVALCSSYPTQVAAAGALALLGVLPQAADGELNATFVFGVSTLDAVLVVGLVVYLLRRQGESLATVFLGHRLVWREAMFGIALVPLVTIGVAVVVRTAQTLMPSLHNVAVNPLTAFMVDPAMTVAFGAMVVLAGGVREEMQRAFQLHRLRHHVSSPLVALVITSVAFGLGHTVQGRDVAMATFGLGLFWGALYLRRQSLVAAGVSHALFNLVQVWAASRALMP